jgi:rod shape-determining protein MreD
MRRARAVASGGHERNGAEAKGEPRVRLRRSRMPQLSTFAPARPEEILLPVQPWFVLLTLLLGLILNIVPASGLAQTLKPDFLALVLLYWCIREPRMISVGIAWCLGLVMDVADATVFGQHALAYAVLAYAAEYFRRRVLRFPLWQQAAQVAVLLLFCTGLVLLVRVVGGAPMPRWTYVVALVGALLWPVVTVLLQWPQRPRRSKDRAVIP